MSKREKILLIRIIVTAVLFIPLFIAGHIAEFGSGALFFIPLYIIIGYNIFIKAFKNILNRHIFDENLLVIIATVAAFFVGEYEESVAVILLFQTGELFQGLAVEKSRKSIADLMDICPVFANLQKNGEITEVDPEDVEVGDIIIVKAGEKIPLDGVVIEGSSMLNTSALTGEPVPKRVTAGDAVLSGCINQNSLLKIRVTKIFEDSAVSKILELTENATSKKAKSENFITKFAHIYTPFVTVSAIVLSSVPPLFFGGVWREWILRGCIFLVISCPCALVISVPLGFFGGIGALSRKGVLIKGSNYLERVSKLSTIVFDKTGTLTKGDFTVSEIYSVSKDEKLLEYAALAESYSNHPIAISIREFYKNRLDLKRVEDTQEIEGKGICAVIDGEKIYLGNAALMKEQNIDFGEAVSPFTVIYVAKEKEYLGYIVISDTIKAETKAKMEKLRSLGVNKFVMLTGDREQAANEVAKSLNIDNVYAGLLPHQKVERLEEILANKPQNKTLAFVGDGINDAPVLGRADIGIAMGALGSDAAIEAADVVIMDDNIGKIVPLIEISRKTMRIVTQNIVFAIGVKALVLSLGAFGMANMWMSVFADVGVSVLAILNSMRTLKKG